MAKWAQWFIDNNMRYALYLIAFIYLPFAVIGYIAINTLPDLWKDIVHDFKSIGTAKKSRSKHGTR